MNVAIATTDLCLNISYVFALIFKVEESYWSCQINGFIMQMLNAVSILLLVCLAMYQYWIIVIAKPHFSINQTLLLISIIFVTGSLFAAIPFYQDGYILRPSRIWCGVPLASKNAFHIVLVVTDLLILFVTPIILISIYFHIW